jgi:hypothetical protein
VEEPYAFISIDCLLEDFEADIKRITGAVE